MHAPSVLLVPDCINAFPRGCQLFFSKLVRRDCVHVVNASRERLIGRRAINIPDAILVPLVDELKTF
jgi:hypothetical protein